MVTANERLTTVQATDTTAVYGLAEFPDGSLSNNDVYWRPLAGGTEMRLSLTGEQYVFGTGGEIAVIQNGTSFVSPASDVLALDVASGALFEVPTTAGVHKTVPRVQVVSNGNIRIAYNVSDSTSQDVQVVEFNESSTQLAGLSSLVQDLSLPPGTSTSLDSKLQSALAAAQAGKTAGACGDINAFISEVNAQTQTPHNPNKKITAADAAQMIAAAMAIKATLGCP